MEVARFFANGGSVGPGITVSGAANAFLAIDDPHDAPDDDATYFQVLDTFNTGITLMTFDAPAIPAGSVIDYVRVYMRLSVVEWTTEPTPRVSIRVGAPTTSGATQILTLPKVNSPVYETIHGEWTVNPVTGLAWTVDEVNRVDATASLVRFQLRIDSADGTVRVTQGYLEIGYTPPASGPVIPSALIGGLSPNIRPIAF